jgi:polyisoprenoid-binding protein YceI
MNRTLALLSLVVALGGCDQAKKAMSGDDKPDPNPVEPDPVAMELGVANATVSMITVKDGDTEVPGKFEGVTGTMTFADGKHPSELTGSLDISLASWDSGLELRDDRVKSIFFEVAKHQSASFRLTSIEDLPEEGMEIGSDAEGTAKGRLTIGGTSVDVEAKVKLGRSGETDFHLDTVEPFVVSIESLQMTDPLKALMKECAHESVDDNVRVSVRLDLTAEADEHPVKTTVVPREKVKTATREAQAEGKERHTPDPVEAGKGGKAGKGAKAGKGGKGKGGKGKGGKGKGKGGKHKKKK